MTEEVEEAVEVSKGEIALADATMTYKSLVILADMPSTPKHYQDNPRAMWAATEQGREIGIGPMTAINNIDIIKGSVSMRAKLISALIHKAHHIIKLKTQTNNKAVLDCFRYHAPTNTLIKVGSVQFTIEDADLAGLVSKGGPWKKYPKAMLTNRALTMAGRLFYGDCLAGIGYVAEEIHVTDDGEDYQPDIEDYVDDADAAEAATEILNERYGS